MFYTGIGSRHIYDRELHRIEIIGKTLKTEGYVLRSGHDLGADWTFELAANDENSEIYVPWPQFGTKPYRDDPGRPIIGKEIIGRGVAGCVKKFHPAPEKLTEGTMRLMLRCYNQVMGEDTKTPSDLVICVEDELDDKENVCGGTGFAVRVAHHAGVPVWNIRTNRWLSDHTLDIDLTPTQEEIEQDDMPF